MCPFWFIYENMLNLSTKWGRLLLLWLSFAAPDFLGMMSALVWQFIPLRIQFMSAFPPTDPRKTERTPPRACWQPWPPGKFTRPPPAATSFSLPSKSCSSDGSGLSRFSTRATVYSRYRDAFSSFSSALNPKYNISVAGSPDGYF